MPERTVLVTGCSSGFGLGIANRFAARGWHVVAGLRDARLRPAGLDAHELVQLDLSKDEDIGAVASRISRLDCLVNNAGYGLTGPFATFSLAQMQQQMQVNFLGPVHLTQALLPALARARGRIINVSSLAGTMGLPMNSLYCASKYALEGWSEAMHHELSAHGVQIALVEPGGFRTQFAHKMLWGEAAAGEASIEAHQLAAYRAMQQRMLSQPGNDPRAVVDAVLRLAQARHMKLRTRVGANAKVAYAVRRLMPEGWSLALISRVFRQRLAKEKS
jgi:NAD(P)-dependent dehydrogenase (short-subunit alcohol dehydrogenase family)